MRISDDTRIGLIEYLCDGIDLSYKISDKSKKHDMSYLMQYQILRLSHECLIRQIQTYETLFKNNMNSLIYHTLLQLTLDGEYVTKARIKLLNILSRNQIEPVYGTKNILCQHIEEKKLVKLCIMYHDYIDYIRNNKAKDNDSDNNIASDSFLFEKTLQKVLMGTVHGKIQGKEISGRNDIGQALRADAIVCSETGAVSYILDAKYYSGDITYKGRSKEIAYREQGNRFQMCSYLEQYCTNTGKNQKDVKGIIVHAVDNENYEKWKVLENRHMDIGRYSIELKFIHIDRTADDIKQQFRNLI